MGFKFTLQDIQRAGRVGQLTGNNDFELTREFVRQTIEGADKLNHDGLHTLASRVFRQLVDGEELEIDDESEAFDGLPDLSLYAGSSDLERAMNAIRDEARRTGATLPDDATLKKQAEILLQKIAAAIDNAAAPREEAADDATLSDHAQALRNLDARDPAFRALSHEEKCFGPRVREEVERVRERRTRLAAEREESSRLLADENSVAPPKVPVQPAPPRTGDDMTLAQLRMYPPAPWARSDGDVAKCISYFVQVYGQLYASKRWEDQNAQAVAFVNMLYRREGVRGYPSAAGGAR